MKMVNRFFLVLIGGFRYNFVINFDHNLMVLSIKKQGVKICRMYVNLVDQSNLS